MKIKRKIILAIILLLTIILSACNLSVAVKNEENVQAMEGEIEENQIIDLEESDSKENTPLIPKRIAREKLTMENENKTENFYIEYQYDDENSILEKYRYDENGNLVAYHVEEYDADGNILSNTWHDGNGDIKEKTIFTYNEEGQELTKEYYSVGIFSFDSDDTVYTQENVYDNDGNLKKSIRYEDGESYTSEEMMYNDDGEKTKRILYYSDGNILSEYQYEYNSDGNVIREFRISPANLYFSGGYSETIYTYDEKGNMIEKVYSGSGDFIIRDEYKYDENSYLIQWKQEAYSNNSDSPDYRDIYVYEYEEIPS